MNVSSIGGREGGEGGNCLLSFRPRRVAECPVRSLAQAGPGWAHYTHISGDTSRSVTGPVTLSLKCGTNTVSRCPSCVTSRPCGLHRKVLHGDVSPLESHIFFF